MFGNPDMMKAGLMSGMLGNAFDNLKAPDKRGQQQNPWMQAMLMRQLMQQQSPMGMGMPSMGPGVQGLGQGFNFMGGP